MPEKKGENGDDPADPMCRRWGMGEREEVSPRTWILSLPGYRVLKYGKEKEEGGWILGNGGFPESLGRRSFKE
jgi:hypothetical protein